MARFCTQCGAQLTEGAAFCTACGSAAQPQGAPPPQAPPQAQQAPPPQQGYQPAPPPPQSAYQPQPPPQQYPPQAAYPPPMYPPMAAQQPPRKRKGLGIVLGILGTLFVCGIVAVGLLLFLPDGGGNGNGDWDAWELSPSQQRVVAEFGYPETFSVYYGVDAVDSPDANGELPIHRLEVWDYYTIGSRFTFKDGLATGVYDAPEVPVGTEFPLLRPEELALGMSLQDATDVIGALPTGGADIAPDVIEGLEVYTFEGQVAVSFEQGLLVGVETVPVTTEGGM